MLLLQEDSTTLSLNSIPGRLAQVRVGQTQFNLIVQVVFVHTHWGSNLCNLLKLNCVLDRACIVLCLSVIVLIEVS